MTDREDEDLRRLLGDTQPHLADDGFTARVMERLPRRRSADARPWVLSLTTLVACALGLAWAPVQGALNRVFGALTAAPVGQAFPFAAAVVVLVMVMVTVLVVAEDA